MSYTTIRPALAHPGATWTCANFAWPLTHSSPAPQVPPVQAELVDPEVRPVGNGHAAVGEEGTAISMKPLNDLCNGAVA